jgi:D-alanyl-D-alanine-carboxypeptidase/D-alanyl-D-alanine-endopeptidase
MLATPSPNGSTMSIPTRRTAALTAALLVSACASVPAAKRSTTGSPPVARASFPLDDSIRSMLAELVPEPALHGMIVGLIEPDGSRRVIAHGSAGPGGPPLDDESVMELGSLSKPFAGLLLADMARRGEVALTEPVQRLLPRYVRVPSRNGKQITLLDLATLTSGLPPMPGNFPSPPDAKAHLGYTTEQMYEFLSSYELPRDPGEKFEYSNFVSLLGHALALRAGKPYEALLRERVLAPLGLDRTAATLTPEMERRLTRGTNGFGDPQPYFVAPAFVPSGGYKSTMNDMLAFAAAHLAEADTGLYAAMRETRRPYRRILDTDEYMGLGWGADDRGAAGNSGGTFGYHAHIYVDPAERRAVVVMTNFAGRDGTLLGLHLRDPARFPRPKPSVGRAMASIYRKAGIEEAMEHYRTLRETAPDRWRFEESELNSLGYWLMRRNAADDAIAIFRLNTETYPQAPNPHNSLGDAYLAAGRLEEATESYRRAVALAEAASHPGLARYREDLEKALQQRSRPE